MTDAELLALHAALVGCPSVSGSEAAVANLVSAELQAAGLSVLRLGDSLWTTIGPPGPRLVFNSHLDTVPVTAGWTFGPFPPVRVGDRLYGPGSNDAKASVAAMIAALLRLAPLGQAAPRLGLMLVAGEETNGRGTEELLAELVARGEAPAEAVVGEPTGLQPAVAQKGLLVLQLVASGTPCHAANASSLAAPNAIRLLARDLVALEAVDLGPADPELGPVTLEPTVLQGGLARNALPPEASCILDVRTNPAPTPAELVARLRGVLTGELRVLSERLRPCALDAASPLLATVRAALPEARPFASRTLSDWVFFAAAGIPALKLGPGESSRSHTADEFVTDAELLAGARCYEALALARFGAGGPGGGRG